MTDHPRRTSNTVERVERADGVVTLLLSGELDLSSLVAVREALDREYRFRLSRVVLDLAAVDFLDSSALHFFVTTQKRLEAEGCLFEIVHVAAALRSIFTMTGLDHVLLGDDVHDGRSTNSREAPRTSSRHANETRREHELAAAMDGRDSLRSSPSSSTSPPTGVWCGGFVVSVKRTTTGRQ